MNKSKVERRLKVLETCYDVTEKVGLCCQRKSCPQWINYENGKNCVVLTTQKGPLTLREIGKIYGLTRMRICQIEKNIYQKIRTLMSQQV